MRRKPRSFIIVLLLLNLLIFTPISNGEETTTSYINGGEINSDIIINDGELVIITDEVIVNDGVEINIKEGGILNVSGKIQGTNFGTTLLPYGVNSSILIPNIVTSGTKIVEITINLDSDYEYGPSIFWNENWENITNESKFTITVPFSYNDDPLLIHMLGNNIYGSIINSIILSVDDSEVIDESPWYFDQEGLRPYNSRNWNLINEGVINLQDSEIVGANISGSGIFNSVNSFYNLSSPIMLTEESEFNLQGGGLDGTETDEYIEGPWGMEINWTGAESTGDADRWIKTLSCQKITFPPAEINFIIKDISWYGTSKPIMDTTNSEGEYDIMCDSNYRMVEIVNSKGEIYLENAFIEAAWWNSPWGNYSVQNVSIGFESSIEISLDLPQVNIISMELNKNLSIVDEPIEVTLTLENTGSNSALVPIECKLSDGSDADITPFGQTVLIAAGETGIALVDWRNSNQGNESLTCKTLKPSGFENSELLGNGTVTSEMIVWESLTDSSENAISSIIVIVILFIGVVGLVTYLNKTSNNSGHIKDEKTDPVKKE